MTDTTGSAVIARLACDISAEFIIFQQDNAPAHEARETINLLE